MFLNLDTKNGGSILIRILCKQGHWPLQLSLLSSCPGSSYFFKGKEYWRVLASDMEVEAGFPQLIAKDWLLCTEMQSDSPNTDSKNAEGGGQHLPDHAENGYEVCSCTSNAPSQLGVCFSLSLSLWLLPPLWTLLFALGSTSLWWESQRTDLKELNWNQEVWRPSRREARTGPEPDWWRARGQSIWTNWTVVFFFFFWISVCQILFCYFAVISYSTCWTVLFLFP